MPRANLSCPPNWPKELDGGSRLVVEATVQGHVLHPLAVKQNGLHVIEAIHDLTATLDLRPVANRGLKNR